MATLVPTGAVRRDSLTLDSSGATGGQLVNVTEVEEVALTPLLLTKSPENLYAPHTSGDLRMERGGPSSASSKRVAVMSVGRSSRTVSVPPSGRNSVFAVIGLGSWP